MGRLTAEPELRQTNGGISVCRFTIACDRSFVAKGQERQADFINVTAWRQQAEFICRYFGKGRMICVEGSLRTSTYEDKKHPDVRHYVTEIYAEQVHFTGEKANDGQQSGGNYGGGYSQNNGGYSQNQGGYSQNNGGYSQKQNSDTGYYGNNNQAQQQFPQNSGNGSADFGGLEGYEDAYNNADAISDGDLPF